jgi:hypothetical protein
MDSNLFETDIFDNLGSIGVRSNVFGFNADFSLTAGSNKVDYTVGNSKMYLWVLTVLLNLRLVIPL